MNSHSTEQLLFIFILLLTVIGYSSLQKAGIGTTQKSGKIITGLLMAVLLVGGAVKFFVPLTAMFANQIAGWVELSASTTLLSIL